MDNCNNGSGSSSRSSCCRLFDELISSDLTLRIIEYLNVIDSGRLACASQRYYYLVHQYRQLRGPELVTTSSLSMMPLLPSFCRTRPVTNVTVAELMVRDCKRKLQARPNLVLNFSTPQTSTAMFQKLSFPSSSSLDSNNNNGNINTNSNGNTISLGAVAHHDIQVNQPKPTLPSQPKVEHSSNASLMAMNFPVATIMPFVVRGRPELVDLQFLEQRLRYHNNNNDKHDNNNNFWKAVILYVVGNGVEASDMVTTRMQTLMPNAVIVGGVCREGNVSMPTYTKEELSTMSIKHLKYILNHGCVNAIHQHEIDPTAIAKVNFVEKSDLVDHVYDALQKEEKLTAQTANSMYKISGAGVFGVCLGGNVPVKSVVSRGVHSVLNNNGPPRPYSNLVVQEVSLTKSGDEDYIFGAHDQPPIHLIRKIRDTETGTVYSPIELISEFLSSNQNQIDFLGLKRRGSDGFEMSSLNDLTQELNAFAILTDGSEAELESLQDAELDFFSLNGNACMEDLDRTMSKLQQQTEGEQILGALMYTCSGRGPRKGHLIPEDMSDAQRFAKVFPKVPCLGFYANGEYGPVALAGNENVFQTGRASHQGFTAVFALFIVPVKDGPATYDLDDSNDNVRQFILQQLHHK